ncbi:hypothetical protein AAKU55_000792 [Oxalobacteraceae bacterium GrIS 1.11]
MKVEYVEKIGNDHWIDFSVIVLCFAARFGNRSAQRLQKKYQLKPVTVLYQTLDESYAREGLSDRFLAEFLLHFRETINYDWPNNVDYMPVQENWILSGMKLVDPLIAKYMLQDSSTQLFGNVELPQYRDSLARGFGICSQLSLAGADLLQRRYGIDARVAGLNGHVVMQVFDGRNNSWIVDPSFKTFARGSVETPEKIPEEFYKGNDKIKKFYFDKETNFVSSHSGWGGYSYRSSKKQEALFYFIIASYYLKWILPILGMVFGFVYVFKIKKNISPNQSNSIVFDNIVPVIDRNN